MKHLYIIFFSIILLSLGACKEHINDDSKNSKSETDWLKVANWIDADSIKFEQIMKFAQEKQLHSKAVSGIEMDIAKLFLGTPYVGKTLEQEGEEVLVINFRELDCTTFLENVVALSLCVKEKKISFNDFAAKLTSIRYRDGVIKDYPSRLHYFSDWLIHNENRGLLSIISNTFGQDSIDLNVNWMSTHPQYYAQLDNEQFVDEIAVQEKKLSKHSLRFIPKNKINKLSHHIQNGDLIAITTDINGLDVAHVGLAYFVEDKLHLLHASSVEKEVIISKNTLQAYLEPQKKRNGIIVARLR